MNRSKKALVVDDDLNFSQLLECALEDDFHIFRAADGAEGIRLAKEIAPAIILMDVMMPIISGIELVRMLTEEEDTRNIPVIILTGSHLDKGTPIFFKQEPNVKLFLNKQTPILEIIAAVKSVVSP
jgi:adenylate cyclase